MSRFQPVSLAALGAGLILAGLTSAAAEPQTGAQTAVGSAQAPADSSADSSAPTPAELARSAQGLRDTLRDEIHPDEQPLYLRGLELDGNDLRSRTPALAKNDARATFVDEEELYLRALEIHGEGVRFDSAPPVRGRSERSAAAVAPEPARPALIQPPAAPIQRSDSWLPLGALVGLLIGLGALLMAWPRLSGRMYRWVEESNRRV